MCGDDDARAFEFSFFAFRASSLAFHHARPTHKCTRIASRIVPVFLA